MWSYLTGAHGPSGFGSASTAEDVASKYDAQVKGKVAIVTGATSGIGHETARVLATHGATIYVGARSVAKAEEAIKDIRTSAPEAVLKPFICDLGNLKSIKAAVDTFLAEGSPLHLLINNAGVMMSPLLYTDDGLELQFGANHIGHYYLTTLLLDKLQASAPARVVCLSSAAHRWCPPAGILFDDLDAKKSYDPQGRYGNSKLANLLFARAMQARSVPGVSFYSVHPGVILTQLSRYMSVNGIIKSLGLKHMPFGKSIPQGAATTVFCALSDTAVAGAYHADCNVVTESRHPHFNDVAMGERLLEVSAKIVQEKTVA